jgi:hypothetical protein
MEVFWKLSRDALFEMCIMCGQWVVLEDDWRHPDFARQFGFVHKNALLTAQTSCRGRVTFHKNIFCLDTEDRFNAR